MSTSAVVIKIIGMSNGYPTPFDGQYLKIYDPDKVGYDVLGRPMLAYVVTTKDPSKAMQFADQLAAWECWRQLSGKQPIREDGHPNRPLTAFTVEMLSLELAIK